MKRKMYLKPLLDSSMFRIERGFSVSNEVNSDWSDNLTEEEL